MQQFRAVGAISDSFSAQLGFMTARRGRMMATERPTWGQVAQLELMIAQLGHRRRAAAAATQARRFNSW